MKIENKWGYGKKKSLLAKRGVFVTKTGNLTQNPYRPGLMKMSRIRPYLSKNRARSRSLISPDKLPTNTRLPTDRGISPNDD